MEKQVVIIGVGPGAMDYLSRHAEKWIEDSDCLIGAGRILRQLSCEKKEWLEMKNNLLEITAFIQAHWKEKKIAVLASGDPFLYGIGSYLCRQLPEVKFMVISGISAVQYLAGQTGVSWQEYTIKSIHGRKTEIAPLLKKYGKLALYCGERPELELKKLTLLGMGDALVTAGENLSYENEKIVQGTAEELSRRQFSSLTVFLLEYQEKGKIWPYCTGGISDDLFLRSNVPMTKEEVRAVSVAKLRLREASTVIDIGAGTGSVTVEAALHCPFGQVYALEKKSDAVHLIQENCHRFSLSNVTVLEGDAAERTAEVLEQADRIFIGGAGRKLESIIALASKKKTIRIVVNTVTIESAYEALQALEKYGFSQVECVQVSVSKSCLAGGRHLLRAQNPVAIVSGQKGEVL